MDRILRNLNWKYCLVYLDDVIVFANDIDTHLQRLELVLQKFKEANLKLKPSKCRFLMEKVNYLGFLISKDGLQPEQGKVRAISETQHINTKTKCAVSWEWFRITDVSSTISVRSLRVCSS